MFSPGHATHWPELPYPGVRPPGSFVLGADGVVHPLAPGVEQASGWSMTGGRCLDAWLLAQDASPLAGREPVLAYGSNANPMKILAMAEAGTVPLPAVLTACDVAGYAAVWCREARARDGLPPATLIPWRGARERHAITWCTPAQIAGLDAVEGHGRRYRRTRLQAGVRLQDGRRLPWVWAYLGVPPIRAPWRSADGRPLRLADVQQSQAIARMAGGTPDAPPAVAPSAIRR